jgi:lysozyme family protein
MYNFKCSIEFVFRREDGYVNDPQDPGGETRYGISKRFHPKVDIKALTKDQASGIYTIAQLMK